MADTNPNTAEFADPARGPRTYVHQYCGKQTRMSEEIVQAFLADPHKFNSWAFCSGCDTHVDQRECHWTETNESLADYLGRIKASYPASPLAWYVYLAPVLFALVCGAINAAKYGGDWFWAGALIGVILGVISIVLGKLGWR